MATVKVDIKDFAGYMAKLGARMKPAAVRGIIKGAAESMNILKQETERAPAASSNGGIGAFDTGAYLRAWKMTPMKDGATISNSSPYAGVVEEGRRPGRQPPSEPIARWAKRRLGLSKKEADVAGFIIARAIGKRGLKGRHVLASATPKMKDVIEKRVVESLDAEVAKVFGGGK